VAVIVGVLKPCDVRLMRSDEFGQLCLGESSGLASVVDENGNLELGLLFGHELAKLRSIADATVENLDRIARGLLHATRRDLCTCHF